MEKEIKKNVAKDWQNQLPQFIQYTQDKLYKVIGPVIIGLELITLPKSEKYRPHFVIYSLFGNKLGSDIKSCLSGPLLLKEYYNEKGIQYSIPYEKHNDFFSEVITSIKKQTPLLFEENISLQNIISLIDEYSRTSPLSAAPNSYLQASLQLIKFKIVLYASITEAESILKEINQRSWDINSFNSWKIDLNDWLNDLQKIMLNRDELIKQIEINKKDKKISKLQFSELKP